MFSNFLLEIAPFKNLAYFSICIKTSTNGKLIYNCLKFSKIYHIANLVLPSRLSENKEWGVYTVEEMTSSLSYPVSLSRLLVKNLSSGIFSGSFTCSTTMGVGCQLLFTSWCNRLSMFPCIFSMLLGNAPRGLFEIILANWPISFSKLCIEASQFLWEASILCILSSIEMKFLLMRSPRLDFARNGFVWGAL